MHGVTGPADIYQNVKITFWNTMRKLSTPWKTWAKFAPSELPMAISAVMILATSFGRSWLCTTALSCKWLPCQCANHTTKFLDLGVHPSVADSLVGAFLLAPCFVCSLFAMP